MNKNYANLTTPHYDEVDKNAPWQDYPRPSMVRDSYLSLNGEWDLSIGDIKTKVLVPFPPESTLSGAWCDVPIGADLIYERGFILSDDMTSGRVILHLGAIDNEARVWVNGIFIGDHIGGYLPFSFDVTDAIREGENDIKITVRDDLSRLYPYGKQTKSRGGMWYTPVSGIWQSVWMECVPEEYIISYSAIPSAEEVTIRVEGGCGEFNLRLDSGEEYTFGKDGISFTPNEIRLWTPETPELYRFTLTSGKDSVRGYFAMRSVGIAEFNGQKRLTLNGKPYLFNGLLDQGYYPDGIFLPPTPDGYREDILLAKKLGFNMLRKHIKVEPEIFYYLADTLGIAVFQDMVNNSDYSFILDTALPTIGLKRMPDSLRHKNPESRRIFTEHSLATVERLKSFPSVVYYTVFNEGWGQFNADKMYRLIKDADPTRIVDATSGWFIRHDSDVDSHHVYFKPIKLKSGAKRPVAISEFGGYSYRVPRHLFGQDNYGYTVCKSEDEFRQRFEQLYRGEVLRSLSKGVSALVYTQISDVEDETNGLITYDRKHEKLDTGSTKALMDELYSEFSRLTESDVGR